ncbi:hypothetical protein [Stenotrophomonas sp. S39]|uniref:hypothetical protein n=1 Tax=Stenotrophomonas sp. S39 TaxID=2767451 RepID=UPI001F223829|nr:hypothetical protein [Stenotrophomonas sp. S39]
MNSLYLRVIAGIEYAWNRDDDRTQAINRVDGMRVANLRVGDLRGHEAHPAKEFPVLIQAPVYLI